MQNLVFGISGSAESGKDTVAEMIKMIIEGSHEKSAFKLAYADYLKVLCMKNFGYKDKHSNRKILQDFGSKVREVDEGFWLSTTWYTIDKFRNLFDVFIISDVRYENEVNPYPWNLVYPFIHILVKRPDKNSLDDIEMQHESEQFALEADKDKFQYVIDNSGTIEGLYSNVLEIVNDVMDRWDEWFEILKENLDQVTADETRKE